MAKQDYLADANESVRRFAVVAMLAATLVSAACLLLVIGIGIVAIGDLPAGPLYGCAGIFGALTLISGWVLVRLHRRQPAANGRTEMPEWFIQVFGVVFLVGICATAVANGRMWLFGEAFGIALAMIGIRSLLRHPQPN